MKISNLKVERIVWVLLIVSLVLYGIDYLIFGRGGEIGFGFLGNLAFLPIYVLFVTLVVERVLKSREQAGIKQKLNMVIGAFFSEVGNRLLCDFSGFIQNAQELACHLRFTTQWVATDFAKAADFLEAEEIQADSRLGDLAALKCFLMEKRGFMLGLLENPNLLEHDEFTDLLWAVFHLIEELEARRSLDRLPGSDMDHLSVDIKRAYSHLVKEWIMYMRHLQQDYPYLYSLAARTNPMNPDARVEVV